MASWQYSFIVALSQDLVVLVVSDVVDLCYRTLIVHIERYSKDTLEKVVTPVEVDYTLAVPFNNTAIDDSTSLVCVFCTVN